MKYRIISEDLQHLARDRSLDGSYQPGIGKAFRIRIQAISAACDVRDLYAMKSYRFEKLKGNRSHQKSMRLNDKMRLIVEQTVENNEDVILIVSIEDYH